MSLLRVAIQQASLASYRVPVFRDLARKADVELTVFSGGHSSFDNQTSDEFRVEQVPIKRFRLLSIPVFWHSAQWVCVDKRRFDVAILVWNVQYLNLVPAVVRARLTGVRVVLWGHGYSKRESWIRRFCRELVGRLADGLLFYDYRTATDFEQRNSWARGRCFVAPNTIETKYAEEHRVRLLESGEDGLNLLRKFRKIHCLEGPTLLYVSRFDTRNRLDLLIEALSLLVASFPSLRLVVIGKGNPESETLSRQIDRLGLTDRVIVLGAIYSEDELAPWFCSADVFVYPSNIGLSLNHAMAYGLPVITSDSFDRQNPEIFYLHPGENGLVYRDGDAWDLARAIREGVCPVRRAELGANAIQTMRCWTLARMVSGLHAGITGVIDRNGDWDTREVRDHAPDDHRLYSLNASRLSGSEGT